jgi:hypothetical protein
MRAFREGWAPVPFGLYVALGGRVCQTRQRVWTEKRPREKALTDIFAGLGAVTSEYRCDSFEYPTACFERPFCIDGGLMAFSLSEEDAESGGSQMMTHHCTFSRFLHKVLIDEGCRVPSLE